MAVVTCWGKVVPCRTAVGKLYLVLFAEIAIGPFALIGRVRHDIFAPSAAAFAAVMTSQHTNNYQN